MLFVSDNALIVCAYPMKKVGRSIGSNRCGVFSEATQKMMHGQSRTYGIAIGAFVSCYNDSIGVQNESLRGINLFRGQYP
jgi:hypothetical protein